MTATAQTRGHRIYFDGKDWRYSDDDSLAIQPRACNRCGRFPTRQGFDSCLGEIQNVTAACCGHGIENGFVIKRGGENGR